MDDWRTAADGGTRGQKGGDTAQTRWAISLHSAREARKRIYEMTWLVVPHTYTGCGRGMRPSRGGVSNPCARNEHCEQCLCVWGS